MKKKLDIFFSVSEKKKKYTKEIVDKLNEN